MSASGLYLPVLILAIGALAALALGRQQRLSVTAQGWLLAAAPLAAFLLLLSAATAVKAAPWSVRWNWLPTHDIALGFYLDGLSLLFGLLVTGIGALITLYTGYYFAAEQGVWRFNTYLLLFMTAMLGLVLAGDVITLFIFWEGTSITSFLLVAYKTKYPEARRGAFKALTITGGGGIALLAGLLFVSHVAGGSDFSTILTQGEALRSSPLYLVMLGLVAFGAFTKSAQFPAHIWLPDAMSAPTPASAFLHSATMVKAGIYLMARLNPALGNTEAWFWLLSVFGLTTMVVGAYLGVRQNDLKALLAYSTVSQLGSLMALIGQDTEIAFKALAVSVVAHAFYKSALFLLVGIVDHETGTRELSRLGGLRRAMPRTFGLMLIAALSMAGLPPMFGFLAKETLLATAVHPSLPTAVSWIFAGSVVVAGALALVMGGLITLDVFGGRARDPRIHGHEPPLPMLIAPALPAIASLALGVLPEPAFVANLLASAAGAAFGDKVKVSLALWTGINIPLALSVVAVSSGALLYWQRDRLREWQSRLDLGWSFNRAFEGLLALIDRGAYVATRLQYGRLRTYLAVILLSMVGLVVAFGGLQIDGTPTWTAEPIALDNALIVLRLFALATAIVAALATATLEADFHAILALGISGISVAVLMAFEPAPDVALVQLVVDVMAVVILVLALTRLPRKQRRAADALPQVESRLGLVRDLLVAAASGVVVTVIALNALLSQPRPSLVTPFMEANAKALTGATDIVGAIIVDFRALDTLIEIAVFSMAGVGVYTLLRHAARKFGDHGAQIDELPAPISNLRTFGIGGAQPSPFVEALARMILPFALLIGLLHVMYGHAQPGDGFTAGVIVSLAIGFWYVVFGYAKTRARLRWLRAVPLVAAGMLLIIVSGLIGLLTNGAFLAPVDYNLFNLPLPGEFKLSSGFVFELGIALSVLGSMALMLDTLGHPGEDDRESAAMLAALPADNGRANTAEPRPSGRPRPIGRKRARAR